MTRFSLLTSLLLTGPAFGQNQQPPSPAPDAGPTTSDITFPVITPPVPPAPPPAPPSATVTLPEGVYYVLASSKPFFALASPEGLLTITPETGPLRLRGRFVESPDKVQTKTYQSKYLAIVEAAKPGTAELIVFPAGVADAKQITRRLIDSQVGPLPPPIPPVPPVPPPSPAPIPDPGFRVLIVYETADLAKLPKGQSLILSSSAVRDYLNSKCAVGPDGKTKEWRVWDQNVGTAAESPLWQAAMKRPRQSVPWILISTGTAGYEGPLPATVAETLTLLQKFGG